MNATVKQAIKKYETGYRPQYYGPARTWFVRGKKKKLYPAKIIWSIITDQEPANFNTSDAISGLSKLDAELFRDEKYFQKQNKKIQRSADEKRQLRLQRLQTANPKPNQRIVKIVDFTRNPDVVAERLYLAKGTFEKCEKPAPFRRKGSGEPYLEVHHIVPLADGGDDTIENTLGVCPNCYREAHYGI